MKYNIKKLVYRCSLIFLLSSTVPIVIDKSESKAKVIMQIDSKDDKSNYKYIRSIDELKQYFGDNVTFDDLYESLDSNKKINDEYYEYTKEFIDLISERFGDEDITIFNENLKNFQVKIVKKKTIKKTNSKWEAVYEPFSTTIYLHDEYDSIEHKKYCYFHELWHMYSHLYVKKGNIIYYRNPSMYVLNSKYIEEGFTSYLTDQIYPYKISSYVHQTDEVGLLYQLYGEEILSRYLNGGLEEVQFLLSNDISYGDVNKLIKLMNDEGNGDLENPRELFDIIFKIYRKKQNNINSLFFYQLLSNTLYSKEIKNDILDSFCQTILYREISEDMNVTFDNENYYNIDDLYFMSCNGKTYLLDNETFLQYYYTNRIKNVYDSTYDIIFDGKFTNQRSLREYLMYNQKYDIIDDNTIYVNKENIQYVKTK